MASGPPSPAEGRSPQLLALQQDLAFQLLGGGQAAGDPVQWPVQQHGAQQGAQVPRHHALLLQAAVVLQGQDDGVGGHLEGVVPDGPERIAEEDFGRERVTVVDDRLQAGPVPAVELQAAAALAQGPDVGFGAAGPGELVLQQVGVVG